MPRALAPSASLVLWLLLGLLLLVTMLVWQAEVPTYAAASGVIVQRGQAPQQEGVKALALLFVPASPSLEIHAGQAITVQVTATGEQLQATIATVEPGVISPDAARQRYALTGDLALVITRPSVVVTVTFGAALPAHLLTGERISAQVQVGYTPCSRCCQICSRESWEANW